MSKPEPQNKQNGNGSRWTRYSAYLYLAMALLIVAVATFSIFALNRSIIPPSDYSTPEFSVSFPSENSGTLEKPSVSEPDIPLKPDRPVLGEESGIVDESSAPPAVDEKPSYVTPVNSRRILKPCALDSLVFSATMKDYRVHTGLDIAAPVGAEVLCYAAGTVESVQEDAFLGTVVTVRHEYGLTTVYANLAPELVSGIQAGAILNAGDRIGYVGSSAISESADEPHLHFEMLLNGERIDPEKELFD